MNFYNLDEKNDSGMHVGIRPALDVIKSDKNHNVIKDEILENIYNYKVEDLYNVLACRHSYKLDDNALRIIEVRFILTASDDLLKKYFNEVKDVTLKKYLKFILSSFPSFALKLLTSKKNKKESYLSELYSEEELIEFIFNSNNIYEKKRLNSICILYIREYYNDYDRGLKVMLASKNAEYILKFAMECENHINILQVKDVLKKIGDLKILYSFAIHFKNVDVKDIARFLFESKKTLYILLSTIYLDNDLLNEFNAVEDAFTLVEHLENTVLKKDLAESLAKIVSERNNKTTQDVIDSLFEESNSKNLHIN